MAHSLLTQWTESTLAYYINLHLHKNITKTKMQFNKFGWITKMHWSRCTCCITRRATAGVKLTTIRPTHSHSSLSTIDLCHVDGVLSQIYTNPIWIYDSTRLAQTTDKWHRGSVRQWNYWGNLTYFHQGDNWNELLQLRRCQGHCC